jgi:putative transposase
MDSMYVGPVQANDLLNNPGGESSIESRPESTVTTAFVSERFGDAQKKRRRIDPGQNPLREPVASPGVLLTHGRAVQQALAAALGQLMLDGAVSRRIRIAGAKMCGTKGSAAVIQRVNARLDVEIDSWRMRPIGRMPVLHLGAMTGYVRHVRWLESCTILLAAGIRDDGRRSALDAIVAAGSAQAAWPALLESLRERGLNGLRMVISEDHAGAVGAWKAIWPGAAWQRCQRELGQRALAHEDAGLAPPQLDHRILWIWKAPDRQEAERRLQKLVEALSPHSPQLADWLKTHLPDGFAVLDAPPSMRRRLRTAYLIANLTRTLRRQARVAPFYPSCRALQRVACAVLMETCEDWEAGPAYLRPEGGRGHGRWSGL